MSRVEKDLSVNKMEFLGAPLILIRLLEICNGSDKSRKMLMVGQMQLRRMDGSWRNVYAKAHSNLLENTHSNEIVRIEKESC
jgi:hypothetical protein